MNILWEVLNCTQKKKMKEIKIESMYIQFWGSNAGRKSDVPVLM